MKNKEEPKSPKTKFQELTEDELEQVNGGVYCESPSPVIVEELPDELIP